MRLRLLLDQHLPPQLARELRRHLPDTAIECVHTWRGGMFVGQADELLLAAAAEDGWTLVTYDQRTIPDLLVLMANNGLSHAGVVLVDHRTIHFRDYGLLVRALKALVARFGDEDWRDRVVYLPKPPGRGESDGP